MSAETLIQEYPLLLRRSQVLEIATRMGLTLRSARALVEGEKAILPRQLIGGKRGYYKRADVLKQFT